MNSEKFNTVEYVDYLRTYCHPTHQQMHERHAGTQLILEVVKLLELPAKAKVLEIGCGLGRVMELLSNKFSFNMWGVDVSALAIKEAQTLLPHFEKNLFSSPAELIEVPEENFDGIIFWGVFEMLEQKHSLLEVSRLLGLGGKALLCAVKNMNFREDDRDSIAARLAYKEKKFPITYTDTTHFEALLEYLGMQVEKKVIFEYKQDMVQGKYRLNESMDKCSDIYYIVKKVRHTPFDKKIQFTASEMLEKK